MRSGDVHSARKIGNSAAMLPGTEASVKKKENRKKKTEKRKRCRGIRISPRFAGFAAFGFGFPHLRQVRIRAELFLKDVPFP
jgi:hypothetical protein